MLVITLAQKPLFTCWMESAKSYNQIMFQVTSLRTSSLFYFLFCSYCKCWEAILFLAYDVTYVFQFSPFCYNYSNWNIMPEIIRGFGLDLVPYCFLNCSLFHLLLFEVHNGHNLQTRIKTEKMCLCFITSSLLNSSCKYCFHLHKL